MDASRSTDASHCPVWFVGDLTDPWVVAIADSLDANGAVHRLDCAGPLVECPFDRKHPPRAVVVHRHDLTARDADRLQAWRPSATERSPRLILCVSPYVRYEGLERWSDRIDLIISEATAAEVLAGKICRLLDGPGRRRPRLVAPTFRIEVATGDEALRSVIVDACATVGHRTLAIDEQEIGGPFPGRNRSASTIERVLTIWEVPVLEDGWAHRLEWRVRRTGPVVALAGFADRSIVIRAREVGAAACLELPCDVDDLIGAIERVVERTSTESWPIPPRAEPPHSLPAPPRRKAPRRGDLVAQSPWPEHGPLPRIPSQ